MTDKFIHCLDKLYENKQLNFISIDEAHCVAELGEEFRPKYTELGTLRKPGIPVAALTRTTTSITIDVIKSSFLLKEPKLIRLSCLRKNLASNCIPKEMKQPKQNIVNDVYENHFGQCGIIYCNTQNETCELAFMLKQKGISSASYHGGMERGEKIVNARLWLDDKVDTICCTSAFGMGIDEKDVRYVIRFNLPATIEQLV